MSFRISTPGSPPWLRHTAERSVSTWGTTSKASDSFAYPIFGVYVWRTERLFTVHPLWTARPERFRRARSQRPTFDRTCGRWGGLDPGSGHVRLHTATGRPQSLSLTAFALRPADGGARTGKSGRRPLRTRPGQRGSRDSTGASTASPAKVAHMMVASPCVASRS